MEITRINRTVQIYFSFMTDYLQGLAPSLKRDIFYRGLTSIINNTDELKKFIISNYEEGKKNIHGIKSIENDVVIFEDGRSEEVTFEINVERNYIPKNDKKIIALFSTINKVIYNTKQIDVLALAYEEHVPNYQNNVSKEKINIVSETMKIPVLENGLFSSLKNTISFFNVVAKNMDKVEFGKLINSDGGIYKKSIKEMMELIQKNTPTK